MKFRDLTKDEIDVRVGQVGDGWATLLLYKDARVDMDILDETAGSENWQRRHYEVKGNMYCSVGIKCGGEWIWKDDCGTESNTEKEKGEASDSFKRACFNWGIGRELYTAPFIWVPAASKDGKPNFTTFQKNGKVFVRSGAGIVADSVPEKEHQECMNKAKAVLLALEEAGKEMNE